MIKYKIGQRVRFVVLNSYGKPSKHIGTIVDIFKCYRRANSNRYNKTPKTKYKIRLDKVNLPYNVFYHQILEVLE